jgi:hypothetical protein
MPVAPSFDDLLGQFEAEAEAQRATLQFREGDLATAQQHGAGAMADASVRYAAQGFRETFIDGAEGDALTALVDDHLNMQRQPATAASVDVTFTRTGNAAGTTSAGFTVGSQFDAAGNSVLFTTNTPITWGASDHGPHIVTCTASSLGSAGNVAAATVTRLVDTPFDTSIAITNAAAASGGNEEEGDPELRDRARNFWLTLRRGTLAALEEGALTVASVRVARAVEDQATGIVTVVVGDANGNSNAQMVSDAERAIEQWRAAGSEVVVVAATQIAIAVTGVMVFRVGSDADPLVYAPLVQAAIVARLSKYKQGETVYLDSLKAAGIAVDPNVIEALALSLPAADVVPTSTQTPRAGTITITG